MKIWSSMLTATLIAASGAALAQNAPVAVAERERDLQQAQSDGNAKKVARRQSKLAEEQAKFQQLKSTKY